MAQARIEEGDHIVYIGAGTGYYTAILAHLTGPTGRVRAIEYDIGLAARAAANLAEARVRVLQGDGAAMPFEPADVIYVNAGATQAGRFLARCAQGRRSAHPADDHRRWFRASVARIRPTRRSFSDRAEWTRIRGAVDLSSGNLSLRERTGEEFCARVGRGFCKGGWDRVTRLYRTNDIADDRCWIKGTGWCLAYD